MRNIKKSVLFFSVFLMVIFFFISVGRVSAINLTSDVEIGWAMNSENDFSDLAGTNDLENFGTTFISNCGKTIGGNSGCFSFDGENDYLKTFNTSAGTACAGKSFTWCGWFQKIAKSGNNEYQFMGARDGIGGNNYQFYAGYSSSKIKMVYWSGNSEKYSITPANIVGFGTWEWLCFNFDKEKEEIRIYVNSSEVTYETRQNVASIDADNTPIWIGQQAYNSEWYKGYMKHIFLLCRNLNSSEMEHLSLYSPFPACEPSWYCSFFSQCNTTDNKICIEYSDYNDCGYEYTGDYEIIDCDYCSENSEISLCEVNTMLNYIPYLIFLIANIFIISICVMKFGKQYSYFYIFPILYFFFWLNETDITGFSGYKTLLYISYVCFIALFLVSLMLQKEKKTGREKTGGNNIYNDFYGGGKDE